MKKTISNLIEIALSQQVALGSIFIFTILSLSIEEHGTFLHLFVSSLISFSTVFCLIKWVYFSVFYSLCCDDKWNFFSLSALLLLVYKNERDFCALILFPEISSNSLMRSRSFLVASLEFSMDSIMSSAVTVLLLFQTVFLLFLFLL